MEHDKQLTREQRYQISGLKKSGLKQCRIADEAGVHKPAISREFKWNKGLRSGLPKHAQSLRGERRRMYSDARRFSLDEWQEFERLIRPDMSPEQATQPLASEGRL